MKYLKMLGLAAAAVMAVMAFVGAGTASATALCNAEPEVVVGKPNFLRCKSGTKVTSAVTITGTNSGAAVLSTSKGNISCSSSTTTDKTSAYTGSPTVISDEITALTFTGCTDTIEGCTVTSVVSEPPFGTETEYKQATAPEGVVRIKNPKTTVHMTCLGFIPVTCEYAGAQTVTGKTFNGKQQLEINETVNLSGGSAEFCPATGTETVTYNLSANTSTGKIYIAKE